MDKMRWEPVCELVGHPRRPGSHQWSICPRAELTFCWKSLCCKRSFPSDFCILPLDVALNVNEKMVFFMSIWQIFCQITCHRFCTFTILYLSINSTKYSFWRAFFSAHLHKLYVGNIWNPILFCQIIFYCFCTFTILYKCVDSSKNIYSD